MTSSTGLAYDSRMLSHSCQCGVESNHEENPGRLRAIYKRLCDAGLTTRCQVRRTFLQVVKPIVIFFILTARFKALSRVVEI